MPPHRCALPSLEHAGVFSTLPPPKQRLLSCFSQTASSLLKAQTKLQHRSALRLWQPPVERCWRAACLEGEIVEAAVRIHHFGMHGFNETAIADEMVEDWSALAFA